MRSLLLAIALSIVALPAAHRCWAGPPDTRDYHALRSGGGKCLDGEPKARPTMEDCADAASQRWKLTPIEAGYYTLTTEASGAKWCLDVVNDGKANNRLQLARCTEATGQFWKLTPGAPGSYALTTEWQGDAKCLAMGIDGTDIVPLLNKCTSVAAQRWSVAPDATADATAGKAPDPNRLDGEVAIPRPWKPTFVLYFVTKDCAFPVPDVPTTAATLMECARTGAAGVTCTTRSIVPHADPFGENLRPQHAFSATVTQDTPDNLTFATPAGAFSMDIRLEERSTTLTRRGAKRPTSCQGGYYTSVQWAQTKHDIDNAADSSDEAADSGDESPRENRSPSRPSGPTKKKGLDRGRMCGKDAECDSGACKMENRTRGRCT